MHSHFKDANQQRDIAIYSRFPVDLVDLFVLGGYRQKPKLFPVQLWRKKGREEKEEGKKSCSPFALLLEAAQWQCLGLG